MFSANYSLTILFKLLSISLVCCTRVCSPYNYYPPSRPPVKTKAFQRGNIPKEEKNYHVLGNGAMGCSVAGDYNYLTVFGSESG